MNDMKETLLGLCLIMGVLFQSPLAAQEGDKYPVVGMEYEYKTYEYLDGDTIVSKKIYQILDTASINDEPAFAMRIINESEDSTKSFEIQDTFYLDNRLYIVNKQTNIILYKYFINILCLGENRFYSNDSVIVGHVVSHPRSEDDNYDILQYSDVQDTIYNTSVNNLQISELYITDLKQGTQYHNRFELDNEYDRIWYSKELGFIKVFEVNSEKNNEERLIFELISVRKLED